RQQLCSDHRRSFRLLNVFRGGPVSVGTNGFVAWIRSGTPAYPVAPATAFNTCLPSQTFQRLSVSCCFDHGLVSISVMLPHKIPAPSPALRSRPNAAEQDRK